MKISFKTKKVDKKLQFIKKFINEKQLYIPKNNPLVSIIIPSFNRYEYLLNAIESVENQSYKNFEIIIVNDGSTDPNYQSLEKYKNVKLINLNINQKRLNGFGPGSIRNFGTKVAEGDLIAFLDDDDIWFETKLEKQIFNMNNSKVGMSSTEGYYGEGVYNSDKIYELYLGEKYINDLFFVYKKTQFLKKKTFPMIWDLEFISIHNCFVTSSVVIDKKIYDILGGFRGLPLWSDYDCWLGMLQLTNSIFINEPLFYYDGKHGEGRNYSK